MSNALDFKLDVVNKSSSDTHGEFLFQPLDRGFAVTLGNALRRVLLTSIPGAAITSIRIEGVTHEFTTIDGVMEDIADIILNQNINAKEWYSLSFKRDV